jgi:hypothetical protein
MKSLHTIAYLIKIISNNIRQPICKPSNNDWIIWKSKVETAESVE